MEGSMHKLSISLLAILSVLAVGKTEAAVVDYGVNFTASGFGPTLLRILVIPITCSGFIRSPDLPNAMDPIVSL